MGLYSFIDWVLGLPKPLEKKLMAEIEEFEEEKKVAYITSARQIGREEGEKIALFSLLKRKFGKIPQDYLSEIEKADSEKLLSWIESVLSAKTLNEVFH